MLRILRIKSEFGLKNYGILTLKSKFWEKSQNNFFFSRIPLITPLFSFPLCSSRGLLHLPREWQRGQPAERSPAQPRPHVPRHANMRPIPILHVRLRQRQHAEGPGQEIWGYRDRGVGEEGHPESFLAGWVRHRDQGLQAADWRQYFSSLLILYFFFNNFHTQFSFCEHFLTSCMAPKCYTVCGYS